MHKVEIPQWLVDRVVARRGRRHSFADMTGPRTALLVVDMQNAFLMDGVGHNVIAPARDIVPNINRLASALRPLGGTVVWIQATADERAVAEWSVMHDDMMTPDARDKRIKSTWRGSLGHRLWAELDVRPGDPIVEKSRYSAFIQGSSDIEALLRSRGIDTVIVTGTVTGVCCESTARDAMMRNFRTIMITDANAARTDDEHNRALCAFYHTFGDVMSTDEAIEYLTINTAAPSRAAV
ncbi:MAG: isochorismatase family protein [Gemmatimonas sp.]